MKISTLVVFLSITGFTTLQAAPAAPFHTDNIVLKNFQAIAAPGGAKVIWEFTSEETNVTCKVEKSTDGINFQTIRTLVLVSTRQQALHSIIDKEASGETFYRLRITKESYIPYVSPIVSVTINSGYNPSPDAPASVTISNSVFGNLALQEETMWLQVVDLNGQKKIDETVKGSELERSFKPSFSRLPSGYYVVRVNDTKHKPLLNKIVYKF
ncbi:MAG: hypothetical protein WCF67_22890 [Chitinophagaceae bacterium]